MKRLALSLVMLVALGASTQVVVAIKDAAPNRRAGYVPSSPPGGRADLPAEIQEMISRNSLSASAGVVDTFSLAWYDWDDGTSQGWTSVDLNYQPTYIAVEDFAGLDGGESGMLVPLEGDQSMWCGARASTEVPFCAYQTLPGYGDDWRQYLVSASIDCDSIVIRFKIAFDTEAFNDRVYLEYWDEAFPNPYRRWQGLRNYDGNGETSELVRRRLPAMDSTSAVASTRIRFRFFSDGSDSDEDGTYPTDGAFIVDSLTVECWGLETVGGPDSSMVVATLLNTYYEDFEDESVGDKSTTDGFLTAMPASGYPVMAALYQGLNVLQEDPCYINTSWIYGFFDDPEITNWACGGHPEQGAVPYRVPHTLSSDTPGGIGEEGLYMMNEIWSPLIAYSGSGNRLMLNFKVYRDLALNSLVFHTFRVRSWIDGCPGPWRAPYNNLFFGEEGAWIDFMDGTIGTLIDPGAEEVQIALGAVDMCALFCGSFGDGSCHSHSPLFDDVHLTRVNLPGPQWAVEHYNLFQDNFAGDGTVTGFVRADMAQDVAPHSSPTLRPGDSVVVEVSDPVGLATEGSGPAVYAYVAVWPQGQPGKSGPEIEAPETDVDGKRFPLVDSLTHDGSTWYCLRFDDLIYNRYCFDLRDDVFTPGDTICYVFCAENTNGERTYFSRRLDGQGNNFETDDLWEALASPMEFTCLPAFPLSGILYVDGADDRGGPEQLFFDHAFAYFQIPDHDRYDKLAPSSVVGNGLGSRVTNVFTQLIDAYQTIIWSTGDLSDGLIGDGTGSPSKSPDFQTLFTFLDEHNNYPSIYFTGDNIASEWASLSGQWAINFENVFMNYTLVSDDHHGGVLAEAQSPLLIANDNAVCFIDSIEGKDTYVAYGGCPEPLSRFDLLAPGAGSIPAFENANTGQIYSLTQATANTGGSTARVMLEGHRFGAIRDVKVGSPKGAREAHFQNVISWTENSIFDPPTGIDPPARLANYLDHAYPNPFNPTTTIRYGIRERGHVSLRVYNVAGQLVRRLVNDVKAPGGYTVEWNGQSDAGQPVASGVYFYKLVARDFAQTKKMVLLK